MIDWISKLDRMTESIMPGFFIRSVSMTRATGTNPGTASVLTGEACLLCTWDELGDVSYSGDKGSRETKRQQAERKE